MLSSSSSSSKTCKIDQGEENSERPQNEEVRKRRPRQSRRRSSSSRRGLYNYNQFPLLNMAQARREVATALKLHRAKPNHPQFCPCFNFQPPTLESRTIPNISQQEVVVVPKSISLSEEEEEEEEEGNNKVIMASSDLFWSNNNDEIQRAMALEIHESFHKPIEFPDWLCINDDLLHQTSDSHCKEEDCLQDSDLSRMDIGEIEDVDGDWLR